MTEDAPEEDTGPTAERVSMKPDPTFTEDQEWVIDLWFEATSDAESDPLDVSSLVADLRDDAVLESVAVGLKDADEEETVYTLEVRGIYPVMGDLMAYMMVYSAVERVISDYDGVTDLTLDDWDPVGQRERTINRQMVISWGDGDKTVEPDYDAEDGDDAEGEEDAA